MSLRGTRTCRICETPKPLGDFKAHQYVCRRCIMEKRDPENFVFWVKDAKTGQRKRLLMPKTQYWTLVKRQGGCAACAGTGASKAGEGHDFVPDVTFRAFKNTERATINGLLCESCATALGVVCRKPKVLKGLLLYLRKATQQRGKGRVKILRKTQKSTVRTNI